MGNAQVTLGQHVQKVKDDKHLSLSQIVTESRGALSQTYVSKILHDQIKNPSQEKLQALALAMGMPMNYFVRIWLGEPPHEAWTAYDAVKAIESIIVSPVLTRVVKVLLELEEPELEKCARYVERHRKNR
ncbi:MAG TPA: helix-turn-helix domain-containing protein [Blastocatellia bacterium]|nr:helix-turn-helix domain-containing protein [Blastocatellia bacterium]